MPRVRIELPAQWSFETDIAVRITDVNYGGHAGNDALVGILHEARLQWLKQFGWTEMIAPPVGLIMVDLAIRFKSEAHHGDELAIRMASDDWSDRGFTVIYQMAKKSSQQEVLRARTGLMFFNYDAKKLSHIPGGFRERLS